MCASLSRNASTDLMARASETPDRIQGCRACNGCAAWTEISPGTHKHQALGRSCCPLHRTDSQRPPAAKTRGNLARWLRSKAIPRPVKMFGLPVVKAGQSRSKIASEQALQGAKENSSRPRRQSSWTTWDPPTARDTNPATGMGPRVAIYVVPEEQRTSTMPNAN